MILQHARLLVGVGLFVLLAGPTPSLGQEYAVPYLKPPETADEFWGALRFEMNLGNHQRAAENLRQFHARFTTLGEEEQNKLLLKFFDAGGISPLLKMSNIPALRAVKAKDPQAGDAERPVIDLLIRQTTAAVEARLSDVERIKFFVTNLTKSPEERAYAITQLKASGERSVPAMVAFLRDQALRSQHAWVIGALLQMDRDAGPPLLAALSARDNYLRSVIVDVFIRKGDARIVPDLAWLAALPDAPAELKERARQGLALFLNQSPSALEDARQVLVREGEKYYQHRVEIGTDRPTVWRWTEEGLVGTPGTRSLLEEVVGLNYARKALEIDPAFKPAQVLLISLALDKAYERLDPAVALEKAAPQLYQVLSGTSVMTLEAVLAKALADGQTRTALGAARALIPAGDQRLLRGQGGAPALAKALDYPDFRVQMAAAEAILHIPIRENYPGSSRVVEVLAQALGSNTGLGKAAVAASSGEAQRYAGFLKAMGMEGVTATSGRRLLDLAAEGAVFDLVVLDAGILDPQLPYLLPQLRNSPAFAATPVVILASESQTRQARELAGQLRRSLVLSPAPNSAELFQIDVAPFLKAGSLAPLKPAERQDFAQTALQLLQRIAKGEFPSYDARSADPALIRALDNDELAAGAASVLAARPGRGVQDSLAKATLNDVRPPALRAVLAQHLRSHLQRFGVLLTAETAKKLADLAKTASDPAFQNQAARLASVLTDNPAADGQRLRGYVPSLAPARQTEEGGQ